MTYELNGNTFDVEITRKNNKNTYISIKDESTIKVNTNFFVTKSSIKKMLDENQDYLIKAIVKKSKRLEKEEGFRYLGKKYDIIFMPTNKNIEIIENKIYTKDTKMLNKWLKNEIIELFEARLNYNHRLFDEDIPFPHLRLRDMKTRWGVCNKKNQVITINTKLICEDISALDYVIIHELAHFIYLDHSQNFWNIVAKYKPDYKEIRKKLRD